MNSTRAIKRAFLGRTFISLPIDVSVFSGSADEATCSLYGRIITSKSYVNYEEACSFEAVFRRPALEKVVASLTIS